MVKYIKPNPMMSEKEILENAQIKLEMGIIEPYEVLQALDPNLEDEDAMARIEEIKSNDIDNFPIVTQNLSQELTEDANQ